MALDEKKFSLSESPISDKRDDCFNTEIRIVNKIHDFLNDISDSQITLAITGAWGEGKTSVINLLKNKIKEENKNVIVSFEPLLDGKLEIPDIIELFYLKLYKCITYKKARNLISKFIKGMAIISRFKTTINAGLDTSLIGIPAGKVGATIEYNWAENVDKLLEMADSNVQKNFSDQTKEISSELRKRGKKIYVIIDEIDRLSAKYIINFFVVL